jgi:hypothetical protein
MRSFEFVAGSSAMFWTISRDGSEATVRFGTQGRTSIKALLGDRSASAPRAGS